MALSPETPCFCFIFPASSAPGSLKWGRAVAFHPLKGGSLQGVMPCASVSSAASALLPEQEGLLWACCRFRCWNCSGPNHILPASLTVHWITSERHFFPCWVSSGFLNSAGILLRFYSGILTGVQEWEHPNSTKTQSVRYWAPSNAVRFIMLRKSNGLLLTLISQSLCAQI